MRMQVALGLFCITALLTTGRAQQGDVEYGDEPAPALAETTAAAVKGTPKPAPANAQAEPAAEPAEQKEPLKCFVCDGGWDSVCGAAEEFNTSAVQLKTCDEDQTFCKKVLTSGLDAPEEYTQVIRDCASECVQLNMGDFKDRTVCCSEPGCNSAATLGATFVTILTATLIAAF